LVGNTDGKQPLRRPRYGFEENKETYLKDSGRQDVDLILLGQDSNQ
jgi:hypothetical protein